MAFIFVLSSMSALPAPPGRFADKLAHVVLYAGLSTLVIRALTEAGALVVTARVAVVAAVVSTLYGVSDELHQSFVPTRQADALDLIADAIGASVAGGVLFGRSNGFTAGRRPASDVRADQKREV
jgi:VanZ family protein